MSKTLYSSVTIV